MANTKPGKRPHRVTEKGLANLHPITKETARELGARGGRKTAEKMRKQKNLQEMMKMLLNLPVSNMKDKAKMKSMGIEDEDYQNNRMMVAVGLLQRAITGDPRAIEVLCGISGEEMSDEKASSKIDGFEIKFVDAGERNEKNSND